MGEDWIDRTERAHAKVMKQYLLDLLPLPLFDADEEEKTTFHCQLFDSEVRVTEGDAVTVFMRTERARIGILTQANDAVGYVDGESETDLRNLLLTKHLSACPVPATVVSAPAGAMFFEIALSL